MNEKAPERIWIDGKAYRVMGGGSYFIEAYDKESVEYTRADLLATKVKEAERNFVNNIAAVLDSEDVEAFTALTMKAKAHPDLNSETRSALKSEYETRKEARAEAFRDARYAIVDTPGSTHPNLIHRNGFTAGVNAAIQTLERAAASKGD